MRKLRSDATNAPKIAEKINIEIGREKGREGERENTQNAHKERSK